MGSTATKLLSETLNGHYVCVALAGATIGAFSCVFQCLVNKLLRTLRFPKLINYQFLNYFSIAGCMIYQGCRSLVDGVLSITNVEFIEEDDLVAFPKDALIVALVSSSVANYYTAKMMKKVVDE